MLNRGRRALIRGRSPSDARGRHPARASCPLSRCGIMPTSPGIMPTTTPGCSDMPLRAEGRDGRLRRIDEARRPGSTSSEVPFIVSFAKTESLNSGSPAGLDRHQSGLAASAWLRNIGVEKGFLARRCVPYHVGSYWRGSVTTRVTTRVTCPLTPGCERQGERQGVKRQGVNASLRAVTNRPCPFLSVRTTNDRS